MALSKDKITKHAGSFTTREVHVPAWKDENGDDVVLVRSVTSREFDEYERAVAEEKPNTTALLVAKGIVNPDGSRMFEDTDVNMLGELGSSELRRIGEEILSESGQDAKSAEAIAGNSGAAQSGNSGSDSPETSDEPSPS